MDRFEFVSQGLRDEIYIVKPVTKGLEKKRDIYLSPPYSTICNYSNVYLKKVGCNCTICHLALLQMSEVRN